MNWHDAREVIRDLRRRRELWLAPLSPRRGFASSRVEHLLNDLVRAMPADEAYLEVGTLEGRTIEAAAYCNGEKRLVACDPGAKYDSRPADLPPWVTFYQLPWEETLPRLGAPLGLAFYDGDHSTDATLAFLTFVRGYAPEDGALVVVLDDWDRETVRAAAEQALRDDPRWQLLAEMPEYGDGITCAPNHFGWYFGIGVLGWRAHP